MVNQLSFSFLVMRLHTEVYIGFWIVLDGGSTTLPQASDVCLTILTSLRLGHVLVL